MRIGVITNPNSRKNKHRRNRAAELQRIVGDTGEVHATSSVESIKPILRDFLRQRAQYWVADGGDGALHWMVRCGLEVLEEREFRGAAMPLAVPTDGGTINYVANNVGITGKAEDILAALRDAVERDQRIEEVEVDSMRIEGTEVTERGVESFRTYGFGAAVGGVGQRFYAKYYAHRDPGPKTIVKVVGTAIASLGVAPLRGVPGIPDDLKNYARDLFRPTPCKVTIDGQELPYRELTGVHLSAMSLDYRGVFKLFPRADEPGVMQALVGAPSPLGIVRNLPRMHLGRELVGDRVVDKLCRTMTVEATSDELLAPVIDGEYYRNLRRIQFHLGPRLRIPKVVAAGRLRRAA